MNRIAAGIFAAFCLALPLSAQSTPKSASLFLESDPLGALIQVDGRALAVKTPAFLTDLTPGQHVFSLYKSGYQVWKSTLPLIAGETVTVPVRLDPDTTVLAFPENQDLILASVGAKTENKQFRIPDGNYTISTRGDAVVIQPVFPDQSLLDVSIWSLPVLSTLSVLATLGDVASSSGSTPSFSGTTIASWGFVVGDVVWSLVLNANKVKFLSERAPTPDPLPQARRMASSLFAEGKAQLENGKLEQAASAFSQIVQVYPDAVEAPGAWFYLGRLHSISGSRNLAKTEYRMVADFLQQAAYYDKARKALADLEEDDGNWIQALYQLRHMAFVDPLFTREDVQKQIERLEARMKPVAAPSATGAKS